MINQGPSIKATYIEFSITNIPYLKIHFKPILTVLIVLRVSVVKVYSYLLIYYMADRRSVVGSKFHGYNAGHVRKYNKRIVQYLSGLHPFLEILESKFARRNDQRYLDANLQLKCHHKQLINFSVYSNVNTLHMY